MSEANLSTPATQEELELIAYIEAKNAETQAWVAAGEGRWATTAVSDLESLREWGYTSVAVYIRKGKEGQYWDDYKAVHGIRPRWVNFTGLSDAELDSMLESLAAEAKEQHERDEARNAAELAKEAELCATYQTDTETLVRWGVLEAYTPWRSDRKWMSLEMELGNAEDDRKLACA